ncbi:hypothetical protein K7X08_008326 [Anisodus acutangulus]|uniref:Uncharacterized protein n=1 Tax=Anisodus acutangulus TaxID=402998 RepID=A0A9Q1MTQ4_9SOLA|nr:hypothetical protein K7X08_008326 [Anisodus acutangulus]
MRKRTKPANQPETPIIGTRLVTMNLRTRAISEFDGEKNEKGAIAIQGKEKVPRAMTIVLMVNSSGSSSPLHTVPIVSSKLVTPMKERVSEWNAATQGNISGDRNSWADEVEQTMHVGMVNGGQVADT